MACDPPDIALCSPLAKPQAAAREASGAPPPVAPGHTVAQRTHALRIRIPRAESQNPGRGAAVHPRLPRQHADHPVRRRRHDRRCAEGGLRARRGAAAARGDEADHRPWGWLADRRAPGEDGHGGPQAPGDPRHRRAHDERRRDGPRGDQPGAGRPRQPVRGEGGRAERAGWALHSRAPHDTASRHRRGGTRSRARRATSRASTPT